MNKTIFLKKKIPENKNSEKNMLENLGKSGPEGPHCWQLKAMLSAGARKKPPVGRQFF